MKIIINKLLTIALVIENINCFIFNKLVINGQNMERIKLKNKHGNILVTNFRNVQISNVQKGANSTIITFIQDQSGQHKSAMLNKVENVQNISHTTMVWTNPLPKEEYCVNISDGNWYTTYEELAQRWPIDKTKNFRAPTAFVTNDQYFNPIGSVVENLFLGSNGVGVYVEMGGPLFFRRSVKNRHSFFCFSGDYNKSPYNYSINKTKIRIVFHMLSGTDIMQVYRYAAKNWIKKPQGIPAPRMIKYPIW